MNTLNHKRRTLLRDETGASYAEAIILLPVFIILFAGVLAFNSMYIAKLEAQADARRLAWVQSNRDDCGGASTGCDTAECESELSALGSENGAAAGSTSGDFDLGSAAGFLGDLVLGKVTRVQRGRTRWFPEMFGADTTSQFGAVALMCNETPRQVDMVSAIQEGQDNSGATDALAERPENGAPPPSGTRTPPDNADQLPRSITNAADREVEEAERERERD